MLFCQDFYLITYFYTFLLFKLQRKWNYYSLYNLRIMKMLISRYIVENKINLYWDLRTIHFDQLLILFQIILLLFQLYSDNQKTLEYEVDFWTQNFKQSNKHKPQKLFSVNRPISLNKWFNNLLIKPFAL